MVYIFPRNPSNDSLMISQGLHESCFYINQRQTARSNRSIYWSPHVNRWPWQMLFFRWSSLFMILSEPNENEIVCTKTPLRDNPRNKKAPYLLIHVTIANRFLLEFVLLTKIRRDEYLFEALFYCYCKHYELWRAIDSRGCWMKFTPFRGI